MQKPKQFYYITHKKNLRSILKRGILSHNSMKREKIEPVKIYDDAIVARREDIPTGTGNYLWDYANFYFQARNPMLYRVTRERGNADILILEINSDIMDCDGAFISDGNAAHHRTNFYPADKKALGKLKDSTFKKIYWAEEDDSKREIMAEILIPSCVEADKITGIFVASPTIQNEMLGSAGKIPVIVQPFMFFMPEYRRRLSENQNIILAKGDMFFSTAQTLTVSVNTVGIMGKGLASRAKYQFPDVYVKYQDACRKKTLKMGKPVLYKRGSDIEKTLSDESDSLNTQNGERWFLLFPTKNHWRDDSPIDGIEEGLQWLVKNCKKVGIKSIAMPALGCGLGGLHWKDVGPLMCKYLSQLPVTHCTICLPMEGDLSNEYLSKEFLLPKKEA